MHTLIELSAIGVRDVQAFCPSCGEVFSMPIQSLALDELTDIRRITMLRTLPCPACDAPGEILPREDQEGRR